MKEIKIYTDGACSGNPGPGGYGVVILAENLRKEISGGYQLTTNNRMELMAVIEGLRFINVKTNKQFHITVYSDSKYITDAFQKNWVFTWKLNGFKKNHDLWKELIKQMAPQVVEFEWVKGHASNEENNRCDVLARQAIIGGNLKVDRFYEEEALFNKAGDEK